VTDLLLALLLAVNVALTLGVIRRLREHSTLLARALQGSDPVPVMMTSGARVGPYLATTTTAEPVSDADLDGTTLVGFLSASCPACLESVPSFADRARALPGGKNQALAVVVGNSREATQLCDELSPVARVVHDRNGDQLVKAFGVVGFPAFALLDGPTVVVSHHDIGVVPDPVST
jgi:hypothetical protein